MEYTLREWMNESCPSLLQQLARIKDICFPDWDEIMSTLKMNTHIEEKKVEEEKTEKPEKQSCKDTDDKDKEQDPQTEEKK